MGKITKKLRSLLRSVLVSLGIVIAPYVAHAGYSMVDRGPADTPISGTVRSMETDDPIPGIRVLITGQAIGSRGYQTETDVYGNFHLLVPEGEWYRIYFDDFNKERNGIFFGENEKRFDFSDIQNNLSIFLEGQNVVTIHGFVRSRENNAGIPEIRVHFDMYPTRIGYTTMTNSDGSFTIRVPERESYRMFIADNRRGVFVAKTKEIELDDARNSLDIILEEESFITIRGFVYSKTTLEAMQRVRVNISFSGRSINYQVYTNNEGYFEIRVPERDDYRVTIRNTETLDITRPEDDEIIKIYSERF